MPSNLKIDHAILHKYHFWECTSSFRYLVAYCFDEGWRLFFDLLTFQFLLALLAALKCWSLLIPHFLFLPLICAVCGLQLVLTLLDTLNQFAAIQHLSRTFLGLALLLEASRLITQGPVGYDARWGKFLLIITAAEEVTDCSYNLGESIELIGNGKLETFLYFAFEFVDFLLVVAFELTGAFGCFTVHSATTVEQGLLFLRVLLKAVEIILAALFKLHINASDYNRSNCPPITSLL